MFVVRMETNKKASGGLIGVLTTNGWKKRCVNKSMKARGAKIWKIDGNATGQILEGDTNAYMNHGQKILR